jgi:Ras-related protein Rab-24
MYKNVFILFQNTIGAAYGAKKVLLDDHREVLLGLWDTAGSERYEAMTRVYYRGAKAAIVCYDVMNERSWEKLKFWVEEVKMCEEDCRIYIVGTKIDKLVSFFLL